ncbi:MAG: hypothetical protein EP338_11295 [Bacteroidetes bacterium]|nr:MAG: hypothetical protein EP338_11295 [Bacteroidota bacterium]
MNRFLLLLFLALVSCSANENEKHVPTGENVRQDTETLDNSLEKAEKWTWISFGDVRIAIENIELGWDDMYLTGNDSLYRAAGDTAYLDLMPGEWFDHKTFRIEGAQQEKVTLLSKEICHVSVSTNRPIEVPICVLYRWKSVETEWDTVHLDQKNMRFSVNEENHLPKLEFSREELLKAVEQNCGEVWSKELAVSKEPLPAEIQVTKYLFQILWKRQEDGKEQRKYIVFHVPISC